MDKVRLDKAEQRLEAANISGCIYVYLDNQPSVRMDFNQNLRIYFEVSNDYQKPVTGCSSQVQPHLDSSLGSFLPMSKEFLKDDFSNDQTVTFSDNEDEDEFGNDELSGNLDQIRDNLSTLTWKNVNSPTLKTEPENDYLESVHFEKDTKKANLDNINQCGVASIPGIQQFEPLTCVTPNHLLKNQHKESVYGIKMHDKDATKQQDTKAVTVANLGDNTILSATDQGDGPVMLTTDQQGRDTRIVKTLEDSCFSTNVLQTAFSPTKSLPLKNTTTQPKSSSSTARKTPACLNTHNEQHHSRKRNQPSCSKQCPDSSRKLVVKIRKIQDSHVDSLHTGSDSPKSINDKVSEASKANNESVGINGQNYHCKYCKKTFDNANEFTYHKRVPDLNIQCPKCPLVLNSQASLLVHDFQVHDQTFKSYLSKINVKIDLNNLSLKKLIQCPMCKKSTAQLKEHIATDHCNEMLHQCCVCQKKYFTVDSLKNHMYRHLKPNRGKIHCSKCPYVSTSRADFIRHAASHGTKCVFCEVEFGHRHLLWHHYESEHADQLYTCTLCGKKIAHKPSFDQHMLYHRFIKETVCPVCGITIKGKLRRHMERVHPGKNLELAGLSYQSDKNFPCPSPKCTLVLSSHQNLLDHMKVHEKPAFRFPCPTCDKSFATKSNLTKHIDSVHLKSTIHVCEICGKEATTKHNLTIHKRVHSAVKLFFCEICGQGFNYKASLHGHMKSKHKDYQMKEKSDKS